jgi:hypothetical protein
MSVHKPGGGEGNVGVLEPPLGRSYFVDQVYDKFEGERGGQPPEIKAYILEEVLRPDEEWEAGLKGGRFRTDEVEEIMLEALRVAQDLAQRKGRGEITFRDADYAFHRVVRAHGCIFPFWFC